MVSSSRKTRSAVASAPPPPELPSGFTEICNIIKQRVSPASFINVVGMVKDCRLPMPTRGADFKCQLTLYDLSTQGEQEGVAFDIFRPEANMPQVSARDIVLLTKVKVQQRGVNPYSLITNRITAIRVYKAGKIPEPPNFEDSRLALVPGQGPDTLVPTIQQNSYVTHLYHEIDKDQAPNTEEFQELAKQSLNIKQKFRLLKDVREGDFCDLIVQVARDPYDAIDKVTLYVSDYTENELLFNYTFGGVKDLAANDHYGYTTSADEAPTKNEWVGPYGKRAIQLTCYGPHADCIRADVVAGNWLYLRNVQIKYGHNLSNLEGFMRQERNALAGKLNVDVLDIRVRDGMDPRLLDAIRRYRDYLKIKKMQIHELNAASAAGAKRKASLGGEHSLDSQDQAPRKPNGKRRRTEKRRLEMESKVRDTGDQRQSEETRESEELRKSREPGDELGLNPRVAYERHSSVISSIASILKPTYQNVTIHGQTIEVTLPFTCANYHANVRVVDFRPNSLKDFTSCRKQTEFEVLSDNEDDGSDGSESSSEDDSLDDHNALRIWEWRFALQLEDIDGAGQPGQRLWAVIDNPSGQCLTTLDATDLRRDPDRLLILQERMFRLWGNLEEQKTAAAAAAAKEKATKQKKERLSAPPESSDVEDNNVKRREPVSNMPFTCCIRQYGVLSGQRNKLQTGTENKQWERVFGLFGTKICD
ncbi:hypothetical protein B0T25DRAFT_115031 [Lasiosphaeria hispida]|uniref:Protection of telomeres protein 1 n=1 Tax=Lasiosphaeria hispida TaxID=260671 RepID=A0AAJ0HRA5_9PEZI|nr:hypothetical protein B0T25DRAFT_115031 [Lasiosphaeria hispida]